MNYRNLFTDIRRTLNTVDGRNTWNMKVVGNFCQYKKKFPTTIVEHFGKQIAVINEAYPALLVYEWDQGLQVQIKKQ